MLQQLGQPLSIALALIVLGMILCWFRRRTLALLCLGIAAAGLYLLATPAVAGWLMASLERGYEPEPLDSYPRADAIVVLGGGIMPPAPPQQRANLQDSVDRIRTGAQLYQAGKAPVVMTTGSRPYRDIGPSAAEAAADLLVELGVPRDAITAPGRSTSTREDVLTITAVMQRRDIDSILLVTSAYHMRRAHATFEAVGIDPTPVPTDYISAEAQSDRVWYWLPDADAFNRSNKAWHEYGGLLYYRLRDWL